MHVSMLSRSRSKNGAKSALQEWDGMGWGEKIEAGACLCGFAKGSGASIEVESGYKARRRIVESSEERERGSGKK